MLHILHCPLSGPDLINISLLIIFCITEYVTNKKTLNLDRPLSNKALLSRFSLSFGAARSCCRLLSDDDCVHRDALLGTVGTNALRGIRKHVLTYIIYMFYTYICVHVYMHTHTRYMFYICSFSYYGKCFQKYTASSRVII